jgi:hypothetical protein
MTEPMPTRKRTEPEPIGFLPARIAIQIREGVVNTLLSFDLPVYGSRPPTGAKKIDPKATLSPLVTCNLIGALAAAQRAEICKLRSRTTDEDTLTAYNTWLNELAEWTVAA